MMALTSSTSHWVRRSACEVVLFVDGPLANCPDPTTGALSPSDWSFELIRWSHELC